MRMYYGPARARLAVTRNAEGGRATWRDRPPRVAEPLPQRAMPSRSGATAGSRRSIGRISASCAASEARRTKA